MEESRSPGPTCAAGAVLDLIIVGGGSGQGDVGRKASDVDAEAGPRCGAGAPERGPGGGGGGQDAGDPVGVVRAGVDGRVGVHPDRAIIGVGAGGLGRRVLADPEHVEPDVPGGVGSILGTVGLIAHQYAILSARRLSVATITERPHAAPLHAVEVSAALNNCPAGGTWSPLMAMLDMELFW